MENITNFFKGLFTGALRMGASVAAISGIYHIASVAFSTGLFAYTGISAGLINAGSAIAVTFIAGITSPLALTVIAAAAILGGVYNGINKYLEAKEYERTVAEVEKLTKGLTKSSEVNQQMQQDKTVRAADNTVPELDRMSRAVDRQFNRGHRYQENGQLRQSPAYGREQADKEEPLNVNWQQKVLHDRANRLSQQKYINSPQQNFAARSR